MTDDENVLVGKVDNGSFGQLVIPAYDGPVGIAQRGGILTVAFLLPPPVALTPKERLQHGDRNTDAAIIGQVGTLDGDPVEVVQVSRSDSDARMMTLTLV